MITLYTLRVKCLSNYNNSTNFLLEFIFIISQIKLISKSIFLGLIIFLMSLFIYLVVLLIKIQLFSKLLKL